MNFLSLGKIAFGALASGLAISDVIEYQMNNQDTVVEPPIDSVSIIVCALNESQYIEKCVQSLRHQSIIDKYPEYFELILVDNGSTDDTIELAKPYVDIVLKAPRGKLNARNIGTLYSNGNIIVATDGDCYYPYNWLNSLLKPFKVDPTVAAVSGSIINSNVSWIPVQLCNIGELLNKTLINPKNISGANSAFWKHKYYQIGRFNENFDQMNIKEMHYEEEYKFGKNISNLGKIIYRLNASCVHLGGQRVGCRLGLEGKESCNQYGISIERFG